MRPVSVSVSEDGERVRSSSRARTRARSRFVYPPSRGICLTSFVPIVLVVLGRLFA
jgi:hypothetical protein